MHLDGVEVGSQAGHKEGVGAEGLDAHKAAQIHQVDALQIVQRQLIIEQLRKLGQLRVVHCLPSSHLHPRSSAARAGLAHDQQMITRGGWSAAVQLRPVLWCLALHTILKACMLGICKGERLGPCKDGMTSACFRSWRLRQGTYRLSDRAQRKH